MLGYYLRCMLGYNPPPPPVDRTSFVGGNNANIGIRGFTMWKHNIFPVTKMLLNPWTSDSKTPLPVTNEGNVFTRVCHSLHRGVGFQVCITGHMTSILGCACFPEMFTFFTWTYTNQFSWIFSWMYTNLEFRCHRKCSLNRQIQC